MDEFSDISNFVLSNSRVDPKNGVAYIKKRVLTSIPLKQKALNWPVSTYPVLQLQNMDFIILLINVLIVGIYLQNNYIAIYLHLTGQC